MSLTFKEFETANKLRDQESFKNLDDWNNIDWSNAIAGEAGELCNLTKKEKRDQNIDKKQLADEIADIITYSFLFLIKLGIPVEDAVINKFNEVCDRKGYTSKIKQENNKERLIHLQLSQIKIDKDNLDYIKMTEEICGKLRDDLVKLIKDIS